MSKDFWFLKRIWVAAMCLLFFPLPTLAQTSPLHLVTSPLPISLSTEPGTTITTDLRVKNAGTSPETLRIDTLKFKAYQENGNPALLDMQPEDAFAHWVSFSEPTFTLLPEEWKTITATFTIPKEAAFGYYYAFVFTRATPDTNPNPGETAVVGGTATLVLLNVAVPDAKRSIEVTAFKTDRSIYEFLPTTFTIALKNTGNVHVAPRGNIFLSQGKDTDIALLEVNKEQGNILPDSTRVFTTAWEDGFPHYTKQQAEGAIVKDAEGNPELTLTWNWEEAAKLRFGKYTGKLLLVYDDGTRDVPIEGLLTFWVVPWRVVGGGIFILFFFFVGIRSTLVKVWRKFFPQQNSLVD